MNDPNRHLGQCVFVSLRGVSPAWRLTPRSAYQGDRVAAGLPDHPSRGCACDPSGDMRLTVNVAWMGSTIPPWPAAPHVNTGQRWTRELPSRCRATGDQKDQSAAVFLPRAGGTAMPVARRLRAVAAFSGSGARTGVSPTARASAREICPAADRSRAPRSSGS